MNWLIPNAQKNMMEPVLVELTEGVSTPGDIPHEGEEFGFVLEGKISIVLGNKNYLCKKARLFITPQANHTRLSIKEKVRQGFCGYPRRRISNPLHYYIITNEHFGEYNYGHQNGNEIQPYY